MLIYKYLCYHIFYCKIHWFAVTRKALHWFKSYLTGRCQRIKQGDCVSSKAYLPFWVPQGSALGPLRYTLYTSLFISVIYGHAIPHHLYADDGRLYVSFASGDSAVVLNSYNHAWPLSSSGYRCIKWKWTQIKWNSSLSGINSSWANVARFLVERFGVRTNPAKSAQNLWVHFDKISPSAHICLQSVAHTFTVSWICGVFTITLMWIVQNYLQMVWYLATLINAIHFVSRHISLTWPFLHRHQHARWPVDVTDCFMYFAIEHCWGRGYSPAEACRTLRCALHYIVLWVRIPGLCP